MEKETLNAAHYFINKEDDRLSWYRTKHSFNLYCEVESSEELALIEQYAQEKNLRIFPIGNGSNVFFCRKKIKSIILKPTFKKEWSQDGDLFTVSSTFPISKLLTILQKDSREGPYYLASVPAVVGGAVAMNAGSGRGKGLSILDFLKEVEVITGGGTQVLKKEELDFSYRKSVFSEGYVGLIKSATFHFPKVDLRGDPIKERKTWAKEHQRLDIPNCGTAFRECHFGLLRKIRYFTRPLPAFFSEKSEVWISNRSSHHYWILLLIFMAKIAHRLIGKKCELEIREVK